MLENTKWELMDKIQCQSLMTYYLKYFYPHHPVQLRSIKEVHARVMKNYLAMNSASLHKLYTIAWVHNPFPLGHGIQSENHLYLEVGLFSNMNIQKPALTTMFLLL